mmetsp:Transcript_20068/g.68266  ORF Transcript_20068/g.68266 Transcript_20068/m.68266 type:complete len:369 (-) Transcript_20068:378-1484(-)
MDVCRAGRARATASRARPRCPRRPAPARSSAGGADAGPALAPLPQTAREMIEQAASVVSESRDAGARAQKVELLLPINQRKDDFTFTEQLDYGDSQGEVFRVASQVTSSLVERLAPGQRVISKRIDDDNEPCGLFYAADRSVLAVTLPTAERLDQIKDLYAEGAPLTLLINTQWNEAGQVVSDFGFGPWKAAAEKFLAGFELTYSLYEKRIGAASTLDPARPGEYMGLGGVARVLKTAGGQWQVFAMGGDGSSECVAVLDGEPSYEYMLKEVFVKEEYSLKAKRGGEGVESQEVRLRGTAAGQMNTRTDWSLKSAAEVAAALEAGTLTAEDVEAFDKNALRAALGACGLPTSGKVDALRERLRAAVGA